MSIAAIKIALDAKLLQLAWITDLQKQVAWEDDPFTPVTGQTYLQVHLLLNTPVGLGLDGEASEKRGIYQVTVNHQEGKGAMAALQIADQVAALFKPVQELQAGPSIISIVNPPAIGSGFPDGSGWYCIPISISWLALPV